MKKDRGNKGVGHQDVPSSPLSINEPFQTTSEKEKKNSMKSKYYSVPMAAALVLLMNSVSVFATATDDAIETSAKESYVFKTYLKADTISVNSKEGNVTLTGLVSEEIHKALAEETVANLNGVKSVDNKLAVKSEVTKTSDALINAKVKLELLSHDNLSATRTDVQVHDGIVSLYGQASSQAQIDLTTEYIQDVDGVREVKNNVSVVSGGVPTKTVGEKAEDVSKKIGDKVEDVGKKIGNAASEIGESIDDASITALVKATLLYHRSTSAIKTKVETIDGVVTLTGTAKNASEKELASKFVQDVSGVKSVVNKMNIEGVKTT